VSSVAAQFRNRELAWLDFNERVLSMAAEESFPLLERLKFLAIFSSNLDEFFQVRVAAVIEQLEAGVSSVGADGTSPGDLLVAVRARVTELLDRRDELNEFLRARLDGEGCSLVRWPDLTPDERARLGQHFERRVRPLLTPLAVDVAHPFPYISNLAANVGAFVTDPATEERKFARVKIPDAAERIIDLGSNRFALLDDLVIARLGDMFPGMQVERASTFRVTRNTDMDISDEDADDLLAAVETELRRRRFGKAVRLEIDALMDDEMRTLLTEELELDDRHVYPQRSPVDSTYLWAIHARGPSRLRDVQWRSVTPGRLAAARDSGESIFSVIRRRDLMVHHPYESFADSVEAFVAEAAADPRVLGIKATLYRMSGDSPVARSLIEAAERGVQVVALVELKARFDEQTNVRWAKALERAGVHVVYGVVGLKTHAKCILVVRDEPGGLRSYAHVGTGNYNTKTARTYEDLGVFTCDIDVTDDLARLFNYLTGFGNVVDYRRLVVAPHQLRESMKALISGEAARGEAGRISIKCNAIADPEVVAMLVDAARAGARVDLLVRGINCLDTVGESLPGLRIRSVLGRYLEHSRMYRFGNAGDGGALYLIGSADLMPRNLDQRVEVLLPVVHPKHQAWIDRTLDLMWSDEVCAFEPSASGGWRRTGPETWDAAHDAQGRIMEWATSIQSRNGGDGAFDVHALDGDPTAGIARPSVAAWVRERLGRD